MINSMAMTKDVFGQHLLDNYHAQGYPFKLGLERDDGFYDEYDGRDYFTKYREWPLIEQKAVDMTAGKVLIVGCGAGRHALELQQRGIEVTGIDISSGAIQVCKERGLNDARILSLSEIVELGENVFDTALMLGANLGLLGDYTQAQQHLYHLSYVTTTNAQIIGENIDFYKLTDPQHVKYRQENLRNGRLAGHFRQRLHHKDLTGEWFEYDFRALDELKDITKNTSWHVNQTLGEGANYIAVLSRSTG